MRVVMKFSSPAVPCPVVTAVVMTITARNALGISRYVVQEERDTPQTAWASIALAELFSPKCGYLRTSSLPPAGG